MGFEFNDTCLFGIEGEQIEVLEPLFADTPEQLYTICIEILEEYGGVLEKISTEFLGEHCEFSLWPKTGELLVKVIV